VWEFPGWFDIVKESSDSNSKNLNFENESFRNCGATVLLSYLMLPRCNGRVLSFRDNNWYHLTSATVNNHRVLQPTASPPCSRTATGCSPGHSGRYPVPSHPPTPTSPPPLQPSSPQSSFRGLHHFCPTPHRFPRPQTVRHRSCLLPRRH
jgi:hypothetical protein